MKNFKDYTIHSISDYYYKDISILDNKYYQWLNLKIMIEKYSRNNMGVSLDKQLLDLKNDVYEILKDKYITFYYYDNLKFVHKISEWVQTIDVDKIVGRKFIQINDKKVFDGGLIKIYDRNPDTEKHIDIDPYGEEDWDY